MSILLGVNIDHIATIREQRGTPYPEPVLAALESEQAGADSITVHLREDRRHIQDRDLELLQQTIQTAINQEMAVTEEMITIAERIRPQYCCFVPEKREELTTEGGLNVVGQLEKITQACQRLAAIGSEVSLFIEPDIKQIDAACQCGAPAIEIHTGRYAEIADRASQDEELQRIITAAEYAHKAGLVVNAGHGLHYHNVKPIAAIPQINALNIGHGIIARALFTGLPAAVKAMKALLLEARA